jgi:hypothetical protein
MEKKNATNVAVVIRVIALNSYLLYHLWQKKASDFWLKNSIFN